MFVSVSPHPRRPFLLFPRYGNQLSVAPKLKHFFCYIFQIVLAVAVVTTPAMSQVKAQSSVFVVSNDDPEVKGLERIFGLVDPLVPEESQLRKILDTAFTEYQAGRVVFGVLSEEAKESSYAATNSDVQLGREGQTYTAPHMIVFTPDVQKELTDIFNQSEVTPLDCLPLAALFTNELAHVAQQAENRKKSMAIMAIEDESSRASAQMTLAIVDNDRSDIPLEAEHRYLEATIYDLYGPESMQWQGWVLIGDAKFHFGDGDGQVTADFDNMVKTQYLVGHQNPEKLLTDLIEYGDRIIASKPQEKDMGFNYSTFEFFLKINTYVAHYKDVLSGLRQLNPPPTELARMDEAEKRFEAINDQIHDQFYGSEYDYITRMIDALKRTK